MVKLFRSPSLDLMPAISESTCINVNVHAYRVDFVHDQTLSQSIEITGKQRVRRADIFISSLS